MSATGGGALIGHHVCVRRVPPRGGAGLEVLREYHARGGGDLRRWTGQLPPRDVRPEHGHPCLGAGGEAWEDPALDASSHVLAALRLALLVVYEPAGPPAFEQHVHTHL